MPARPISLPQIQQRAAERSAQYKQRGTTTERGYGSDWKRASKEFLQRHPLCECDQCKLPFAIAVASNCVDHIKPIATHPHLRMVESNWRAMSIAHHNRHTSLTRNPRKGIDR